MDKVVVKSWGDLGLYVISVDIIKNKTRINFNGFEIFGEFELQQIVKVLNELGGNFEYQNVEVIDTYEKWDKFQKKVGFENNLFYNICYKHFMIIGLCYKIEKEIKIEEVEEKYNVDLKILKED